MNISYINGSLYCKLILRDYILPYTFASQISASLSRHPCTLCLLTPRTLCPSTDASSSSTPLCCCNIALEPTSQPRPNKITLLSYFILNLYFGMEIFVIRKFQVCLPILHISSMKYPKNIMSICLWKHTLLLLDVCFLNY